jgi:hypothetical protein
VAVSPVWRRAPGRAWRRGGAGLLLTLAVLTAAMSAASAPAFVRLAGDDQLALLRAAIPASARTLDSDSVRLVSGTAPTSSSMTPYVERLRTMPGLTPPTTIAFSVAPEVGSGSVIRPVVRHGSTTVRARLTAVDSPAAALVVTRSAPTTGHGVWLPDPVAAELGVAPGDTVDLLIVTSDSTHPAPKGARPPPVRSLVVDGTYAVAADGRRPADKPGSASWSHRSGGLPTDSDLTELTAYLVVTDVATADATATAIHDTLLWTVESQLQPGLTLAVASQTASGVAALRGEMATPPDGPPGPLTAGLVSGIEHIVFQATSLNEATASRASLLAAAAALAGLLTVLAVAVLLAVDRRGELRHGASLGIGPGRTAGLWALESVAPVVLGVVAGIGLALTALAVLGPPGPRSELLSTDVVVAAVVVGVVSLLLVAVTGAVAVVASDRVRAQRRSVPWTWLVVVVAVTAAVSTATTASASPGPVALLTPSLVAFAVGVVAAGAGTWLLRRRRSSSPGGPSRVGAWLGIRRTAAGGAGQVLAIATLALGLGLVLVTHAAVVGTRTAISDRTAVRAGAESTVQIEGTWVLDPTTPRAPSIDEIAAGKPMPVIPPVRPPEGTTVVWRTLASVDGQFGYRDVVGIDPTTFRDAADWGTGSDLASVRGLLDRIAPTGSGGDVAVIAVAEPGLHVGDVIGANGLDWNESLRVVATADAFPGLGHRPMLVAAASDLFASWGRNDPRYRPPTSSVPPRPAVEAWLWSHRSVDSVVSTLQARHIRVVSSTSRATFAADPGLESAQRTEGYQVALAAYVVIAAVVVLVATARRSARRSRAADAMLVRVGVGRRGLLTAYAVEAGWLVLTGLVAAVVAALAVVPLGPSLFDLDRGAVPAFEFRITAAGVLAAAAVGLVAFLLASWSAARGAPTGRTEEVVLRDG